MEGKDMVTLYKSPEECEASCMIAAWPGIGDVSLMLARYLRRKLGMEEVGKVEPFDFFDPSGVSVKDNVVEAPRFPESKFYYWRDQESGRGILLFIGEEQPLSKGYELANLVLDTGQRFKVKRIYTCAAVLTRIHHAESPQVWAVATQSKLLEELRRYRVVLRGDLQIAGLNGLLLGIAKERGIEGICLLGEVPTYAARIPIPKASLAVLEVLTEMLGIKIDMDELEGLSREAEEEMKMVAAEAMGEYIDHFTTPIWEEEEEEEEE